MTSNVSTGGERPPATLWSFRLSSAAEFNDQENPLQESSTQHNIALTGMEGGR